MLFDWDNEKVQWLQENRGICFLDVIFHIGNGDLLDERRHPNKSKYPQKRIFIVRIYKYVYIIPFVKQKDKYFLKTIIPSRKETRRYL